MDDEIATTSAPPTIVDMTSLGLQPMISSITCTIQPPLQHPTPHLAPLPVMQHQLNNLSSLTQVLSQQTFNTTILTPQQTANAVQSLNQSLASSIAAGLTSSLSPLGVNYQLSSRLNPASPLLSAPIQPKLSPMLKYSCTINTEYEGKSQIPDSCFIQYPIYFSARRKVGWKQWLENQKEQRWQTKKAFATHEG